MDALFLYDFQRERGWKAKKGIVYGFLRVLNQVSLVVHGKYIRPLVRAEPGDIRM